MYTAISTAFYAALRTAFSTASYAIFTFNITMICTALFTAYSRFLNNTIERLLKYIHFTSIMRYKSSDIHI